MGSVSRSSLEVASNPSGGIFLRAQSYPRSRSLLLLPRLSVRSSSNPTSQLERLPGSRAISCLMVPLSCLDPLSMPSPLPIFLCIDGPCANLHAPCFHLLGLPAGRRGGRGWSPDGEGPWPCATAADGPHFGVVRPRTLLPVRPLSRSARPALPSAGPHPPHPAHAASSSQVDSPYGLFFFGGGSPQGSGSTWSAAPELVPCVLTPGRRGLLAPSGPGCGCG